IGRDRGLAHPTGGCLEMCKISFSRRGCESYWQGRAGLYSFAIQYGEKRATTAMLVSSQVAPTAGSLRKMISVLICERSSSGPYIRGKLYNYSGQRHASMFGCCPYGV